MPPRKTKKKPTRNTKIWVLMDSRMGHAVQAKGVAEALGQPYTEKKLVFTSRANSPNWMKFPCFGLESLGIDLRASDRLSSPWPELVVACGRRTAPVARYIQKKAGKEKCKLVQILWPGFPSKSFDLIALPSHDKNRRGEQIFTTEGAAHPLTQERLQDAASVWQKVHGKQASPTVALIVGGPTKRTSFPASELERLANLTRELLAGSAGSLVVTTSRRTKPEATKQLKQWLSAAPAPDMHFHDAHKKAGENPYAAFLGLADAIIVTGDSISMLSEACGTGKPVFLFAPEGIAPDKHKRFHKEMLTGGYCLPFEEALISTCRETIRESTTGRGKPFPRLDTAKSIADIIKSRGLLPKNKPKKA